MNFCEKNASSLWDSGDQIFTSSHRRCSVKISVLKNFAKFTAKHLC